MFEVIVYDFSRFLIEELEKIGIKGYLIRFDAGGFIDNEYITYGHSATIIPINIKNKKYFILVDLGIFLTEGILFEYEKETETNINGKNIKIEKENKIDLPYVLNINGKKFYFDPYHEWINPEETLSKDVMRGTGKYKITKQNENGKVEYKFLLDIMNNLVCFSLKNEKIELNFEDFLKIKNNNILFSKFIELSKNLGINEEILHKKVENFIKNSKIFKDEIWTNYTKELSNNN